MPRGDYYKVLGLKPTASDGEIKEAYRRLAKKFHPDLNHDPQAAEALKQIIAAYEVLGDSERRATYDKLLLFYSARTHRPAATYGSCHASSRQARNRSRAGLLLGYLLAVVVFAMTLALLQSSLSTPVLKQWRAKPALEGLLSAQAEGWRRPASVVRGQDDRLWVTDVGAGSQKGGSPEHAPDGFEDSGAGQGAWGRVELSDSQSRER